MNDYNAATTVFHEDLYSGEYKGSVPRQFFDSFPIASRWTEFILLFVPARRFDNEDGSGYIEMKSYNGVIYVTRIVTTA